MTNAISTNRSTLAPGSAFGSPDNDLASAVAVYQTFKAVHGGHTPARIESGSLRDSNIKQMRAGAGDEDSAESSKTDSTFSTSSSDVSTEEITQTSTPNNMIPPKIIVEDEIREKQTALGCICICCVCSTCCLSILATAFFAAGGALHVNEDERKMDAGTALLIIGGIASAVCILNCYYGWKCIKGVNEVLNEYKRVAGDQG